MVDAFLGVLQREACSRGIIVALEFTKGVHEEVARAKRENGIEIELISAQDILDGKVTIKRMH